MLWCRLCELQTAVAERLYGLLYFAPWLSLVRFAINHVGRSQRKAEMLWCQLCELQTAVAERLYDLLCVAG
jgi:hypothetical protein